AGGFGESVDSREARAAIEGLFGDGHKVKLGWMVEDATLPKPAIKVLLNLALIAGDALVRGGQLDVGAESIDGQIEIVVRADGPRIVLDSEMRAALTGTQGETVITPRAAAAYLVHALVAEGGGIVRVSDPEDAVLLFGAAFKAG
ncbi:MAG: histidine phosphotransferase family protein, partial [Sphingomonas sp.]